MVKSIEIIGEAASKVTDETKKRFPGIPWANMIAMRNRLIHAYCDIDLDVLWGTIVDDLPPFIDALENIISSEKLSRQQTFFLLHHCPYRTFFNRDVTITLPYYRTVENAENIKAYIYNHVTKDWDAIEIENVDAENGLVTFKTQVLGLSVRDSGAAPGRSDSSSLSNQLFLSTTTG